MTLKEFIDNLTVLLEKYPKAIVPNPERYSIKSASTLYSDGSQTLEYDWRSAEREYKRLERQNSYRNEQV